jgi:hypothetical protein
MKHTWFACGVDCQALFGSEWFRGKIENVAPVEENSESLWECLQVSFDNAIHRLSPWEVLPADSMTTFPWPCLSPNSEIETFFRQILENPRNVAFFKPVDVAEWPTYPEIIFHPIDLGTIMERIGNNFYRSLRGIQHDVSLLYQNCRTFNDEQAEVVTIAESIKDSVILFLSHCK